MRYYTIEMTSTPPVAVQECIQVRAFCSIADRDAWVAESSTTEPAYRIAGTWLRVGRQAVGADVASRAMSAIMRGAYGGRQNGRAALAEIYPE